MFFRWLLSIHNIFRWFVVLALLWGLIRGYRGWLGKRAWTNLDRRAGMLLTIAYDVQFLLGLILAIISPIVAAAFSNLGAAMQVAELRFFAAEHMPLTLVALIVGHITSALSRKAPDDAIKHRRAVLGYTLVAVITIVAIPWFRPLLRF
jgi:ABC-type transport system involved in cytochrome bd biosynthesis fused ATPase/permease subunit